MLTIHLSLVSGTGRDRDFVAWVAQDVDRNSGLTTLKVRFGKVYDIRLMDYLTHKYPNLETIVVERMPQDVWKTYNTAELVLDMDEIPALLKKMETVHTYALQCIISEIEATQLLPLLKLCGYNACFGRQRAVNSFTTKELHVSSGHAIIASEICGAVKIPATLYMA
ncbi:uncharacterized protein ATC70_007723 [Mucor velutinosus]|uniref:Uncharacterized protein n=1 Tax=Mucor velutinosus TaxID=708070 RepID=A0AAN7D2G8_9FUNG|nr:hypothetical protein ATC70_007723 [Mucor velutinosus]